LVTSTPILFNIPSLSINSWTASLSIFSNDIPSSLNLSTCSSVGGVPLGFLPSLTFLYDSDIVCLELPILSPGFKPAFSISFSSIPDFFANSFILSNVVILVTSTPILFNISSLSINSLTGLSFFSNDIPSSLNLSTCSSVGGVRPGSLPSLTALYDFDILCL